MEPSPRKKNLSAAAAAVLLLVILTAESTEGFWDGCNEHLSSAYKGPCWPWIKDDECARVCIGESWDNISGTCRTFQCFCWTSCDDSANKVVAAPAAATTPIQP